MSIYWRYSHFPTSLKRISARPMAYKDQKQNKRFEDHFLMVWFFYHMSSGAAVCISVSGVVPRLLGADVNVPVLLIFLPDATCICYHCQSEGSKCSTVTNEASCFIIFNKAHIPWTMLSFSNFGPFFYDFNWLTPPHQYYFELF